MNKEIISLQNKEKMKNLLIPGGFAFRVFVIFLLITPFYYSQVKTNMQVFYNLADSVSQQLISSLPAGNNKINLKLTLGSEYSVLNNKLTAPLYQEGMKIDSSGTEINLTVDNALVVYSEMFRDGWFGDYKVSRMVTLHGSYFISNKGVTEFTVTAADTIPFDEINNAESMSYQFTHAEVPAEPFFSGLFEPVAAISAAAAAIILFFTVRSH